MIQVCSLASGSNGNAFYIKTGDGCFLVDAGISFKQIRLRLEEVGSGIDEINGIFITHEHSDHVRGLDVLMRRTPVPVYITKRTYESCDLEIKEKYLNFIDPEGSVKMGDTEVQTYLKSHDAAEPTFFCFHTNGKKICVITDIGYACDNVEAAVKEANLLFLESNYDDRMLKTGIYPPYLKRRVAGHLGHLSNVQAGEVIANHAGAHLEYVFLSHLSENNNTPELAAETFQAAIKKRDDLQHLQERTLLTSRHGVSPMVSI